MTLLPAVLLLGDLVLEAMWTFTWRILVVAPLVIAGLGFVAWLLSAPSDQTRWAQGWVGLGTNLGIVVWLINLVSEVLALWAWFAHNSAVLPSSYMESDGALLVLGIVMPGFLVSWMVLGIARAMTVATSNDDQRRRTTG